MVYEYFMLPIATTSRQSYHRISPFTILVIYHSNWIQFTIKRCCFFGVNLDASTDKLDKKIATVNSDGVQRGQAIVGFENVVAVLAHIHPWVDRSPSTALQPGVESQVISTRFARDKVLLRI